MPKLSIRDLDLKSKTVFIRVDFNVPLTPGGGEITSDKRIRASLPTIQYALDQGAGLILASHLGRPKWKPNQEMSLKPAAEQLAALCDVYVNDAFGSAHRAHASTVGMIPFVREAASGLLVDKELEYLTK